MPSNCLVLSRPCKLDHHSRYHNSETDNFSVTRPSLYGPLPPSKYGRLSEQRLKVPRKYTLRNVVQTSKSYPMSKEKANEMPGLNYAAQSSPAVDVVNDLVGLWTSLPTGQGAAE